MHTSINITCKNKNVTYLLLLVVYLRSIKKIYKKNEKTFESLLCKAPYIILIYLKTYEIFTLLLGKIYVKYIKNIKTMSKTKKL